MASVRWRSPRPASGSRKKAASARAGRLRGRRRRSSRPRPRGDGPARRKGGGSVSDIAAPDALVVDHADRLHHRFVRDVRHLPAVGDVGRNLAGFAGDQGVDHECRQLARLPGLQRLGAGQPGIDIGNVAVLMALAAPMEVSSMLKSAPQCDVFGEHPGQELGDVAIAGGRERTPLSSKIEFQRVPLDEVEALEVLGHGRSGVGRQCSQSPRFVDHVGREWRNRPRRRRPGP